MQCPQCGFQEFDEHTGCAICGFHSHAALKTADPVLQPSDDNLIKFPLRKAEAEKPPTVPDLDLPLFREGGPANEVLEVPPESSLEWREELQQKLRQYRARRGGQKKESPLKEDAAELASRFPKKHLADSSPGERDFKWDEVFSLGPTASVSDMAKEAPQFPPVSAPPGVEAPKGIPERLPKGFELPPSVQRIKQKHQPPRRSDLFQQTLLFEAGSEGVEDRIEPDRVALPIPAASPRQRFLAGVYDLLMILFVVAICTSPAIAIARWMHWPLHPAPKTLAISLGMVLLLSLGYVFFFIVLMQRTPGMRSQALTLVNFVGQTPSRKEALIRTFGYLVSGGSLLLGFLWVLFDVDGLAWHDRVSRTYPIRSGDQPSAS